MKPARHMALKIPTVKPVRGPDGKYQPGPGDRLMEAHRAACQEPKKPSTPS